MVEHYPEILRQFLDYQRKGSYQQIDKTTVDAAFVCGASQGASDASKGTEPVNRKERFEYSQIVKPIEEVALKSWAKQNNLWIDEKAFNVKYKNRFIGAGAEQKVYLSEDGLSVLKVNTGTFHSTWHEYFNRLICHGFLFPSTRYSTVGFTTENESFAVVVKQPFFMLESGAKRNITEPFLNNHNFSRT